MSALEDYNRKQKALKSVVKACQKLLWNSDHAAEARAYINNRLHQKEQLKWKVGYFPTDEHISELIDRIPKETLEYLGFYYPKFFSGGTMPHGHFSEHNLVMPFENVHGDVIAILGRCLLDEESRQEAGLNKYKYSNGCHKELYVYGLEQAKEEIIRKDCVIGVEGQFDAIALHARGVKNVVAFGWANMSRFQMFQLHRYTNNIVLMLDNDSAGNKGKKRIKARYENDASIKLMSPPKEYKDIDEFFKNSKDTKLIKCVIDTINSIGG